MFAQGDAEEFGGEVWFDGELLRKDGHFVPPDLAPLNEALQRLEADDPRKGQIVNLRYFAGLTAEETAAALGVSLTTIEREWRFIKTWLYIQLTPARTRVAEGDDRDG